MTLPRVGLDPVMVQTFDMVQEWGAQKVPRACPLSSDLLAKAFGVVERKFHIKVKVYSRNR
jgi:hypothetical protein